MLNRKITIMKLIVNSLGTRGRRSVSDTHSTPNCPVILINRTEKKYNLKVTYAGVTGKGGVYAVISKGYDNGR